MNRAIYPGTFDPITRGHEDLVRRATRVFDEVIVAIAVSSSKKPFFTLEERVAMAKQVLSDCDNVKVMSFSGLLMDFLRQQNARIILRGIRAASDFEYEFQMALMNRKLSTEIETLFLMTGMRYIYISSSIIKEVVMSGGCVAGLVPEAVEKKLTERLLEGRKTEG